jgi:hypothetical protein
MKLAAPYSLITTIVRSVESAMLDELGSTPDEVAATLRDLGIKGVRNTVLPSAS